MPHIFSSLNKATGQVDLIKADSRGQVSKYLAANFVVQRADPVEVAEAMSKGAKLYDATSIQPDRADNDDAVSQDPHAAAGTAGDGPHTPSPEATAHDGHGAQSTTQ